MAGLNATLYSSPTINTNNIEFNGSNYAKTPSTMILNYNTDFTLEIRFSINAQQAQGIFMLVIEYQTKQRLGAWVNENNELMACIMDGNNGNNAFKIADIQVNTQYTLAYVRNSTNKVIDIYLNGALLTSYSFDTLTSDIDCYIYLGTGKTGERYNQYYLNGKVYAFRYYHKALTAAEVESNNSRDNERFNS